MSRCKLLWVDTSCYLNIIHNQTICMSSTQAPMDQYKLPFDTIQNQSTLHEFDTSLHGLIQAAFRHNTKSINFAWVRHKPSWIYTSFLSIQYKINQLFMSLTQAFMDQYKQKSLFVRCFDSVPTKQKYTKTKTNIFFILIRS